MPKSPMGKLISGLFVIMLLLGIALEIVNLKTAYWNSAAAKAESEAKTGLAPDLSRPARPYPY